jgi:hypothetical protein
MFKQKSFLTGGGHLNEEGIALYVDALKLEKTAELPRETRVHVAHCQECRKEITGLFALLTDAEHNEGVPHPFFEGSEKRIQWTAREFLRAAAAVAAVAGSAALLYYLNSNPGDGGSVSVQGTETAIPADSELSDTPEVEHGGELLAESFTELADLEDLVNAEHRGASIQLVSPGTGVVVADPVVFHWSPDIQGSVYLEILNNSEEIVHSGEVLSLPYLVRKPEAPGLYYWKLVRNEELVLVGKFLVKD